LRNAHPPHRRGRARYPLLPGLPAVIGSAGKGSGRPPATKTRSSSCRIPEIGRWMGSLAHLSHRKQSSSRLARELHLGMAASDARGPQFGEGPAMHFRLSRVRSLPGPTATGLYFTVLPACIFRHDGQRGDFGRPVIGHCDTPPFPSGGVVRLHCRSFCLGFSSVLLSRHPSCDFLHLH
jgi:hypothetical protein